MDLKSEIDKIGKNIIEEITQLLISEDKIASGNLLKSLDYKVLETIEGFTIQVIGMDYLKYVNDGRKPGSMPPIKPIQKWVKERGIKIPNKTDIQTSFIIANSIKRKGIVPTKIVDRSIEKIMNNIDVIIHRSLSSKMKNLLATL